MVPIDFEYVKIIPFDPQPIDELYARFPAALEPLLPQKCLTNPPGIQRRHVFDFTDARKFDWRIEIARRWCSCRWGWHVQFVIFSMSDPPAADPSVLSGLDLVKESAWLIAAIAGISKLPVAPIRKGPHTCICQVDPPMVLPRWQFSLLRVPALN